MKNQTQGSLESASSAPPINGVYPIESILKLFWTFPKRPWASAGDPDLLKPIIRSFALKETEVSSSRYIHLKTGIRFAFARAPKVCFAPTMSISIPESLPLHKRNQNNSSSLKTYSGHLTLSASLLSCHYELGRKPGSTRHTTVNFYFCFQKMPV